jgi:hypothetical protein
VLAEVAPVTRASVLAEARQCVLHDRNSYYGDPEDNFETIARLMAAYLSRRFGIEIPIQPYDVAPLTMCIKLARLANYPLHHDSYVDLAGYAAAGGEVAALTLPDGVSRIELHGLLGMCCDELHELIDPLGEEDGCALSD